MLGKTRPPADTTAFVFHAANGELEGRETTFLPDLVGNPLVKGIVSKILAAKKIDPAVVTIFGLYDQAPKR